MTVASAWVMDRMPESLHYTHVYRDLWFFVPIILFGYLITLVGIGFAPEILLICLLTIVFVCAFAYYPKSHIVFDMTGIHVRDRKRREMAFLSWEKVKYMEFQKAQDKGYSDQVIISTAHPIVIGYILEKKRSFLKLPEEQFSADRFMEQVVRGKMGPESFEKQQLLYFTMPYSCYSKVYMLWKSALKQLEAEKI